MSSREFPVSHEGSTVSLRALCTDDPSASNSPAEVTRSLRRYLVEYCDGYGYRLVSTFATLDSGNRDLGTSPAVTLTATVEARYDGTWGDVRRVLEEDGQLRPSDRGDAPAGFWGDPVSTTVTFGPEPASTPTVGDIWHDTRDDQMYVYGAAGWCEATVPESAFDTSLYEGTWTHDEICARGEFTGHIGWPGGGKTLSAGDTLSWTSTVTITAD